VEVGVDRLCEAEHFGRVDQWQQVVDFEDQDLGEVGQVAPAAAVGDDLEEA
jgi:hypothetical protein